ncbi:XRE family transcriptional regulator [Sphingomonas sp. PAMC26645]|uniref:helix-turn-helix domain-containing protein n=1 Tax=Sphingomonas sp. PAMC26645 TaxID=2565555 RepID=UPI00109DA1DF|nr:helix-turn-helix transcriptional regulator [Sphingomonas sp. PAMC26645]QCB43993.1 XRE family transcriptional regulator [Sphingomonas sp. PAMC26645]
MSSVIHLEDCASPTVRLFGRRLKDRRRDLGMTQGAICERTGISVPYISSVERAQANPTLETIEKLAGAVGLEPWVMIRPSETASDR